MSSRLSGSPASDHARAGPTASTGASRAPDVACWATTPTISMRVQRLRMASPNDRGAPHLQLDAHHAGGVGALQPEAGEPSSGSPPPRWTIPRPAGGRPARRSAGRRRGARRRPPWSRTALPGAAAPVVAGLGGDRGAVVQLQGIGHGHGHPGADQRDHRRTSGRAAISARAASSRSRGSPGAASSWSTWVGSGAAGATSIPASGPPSASWSNTRTWAVREMVSRAENNAAASATASTVSARAARSPGHARAAGTTTSRQLAAGAPRRA